MKKPQQRTKKYYERYLWEGAETASPAERLAELAVEIFLQYPLTRKTRCVATFYPYSGLKSTVKVENKVTRLRISDILSDAPEEVLQALIHILVNRASGKKPDKSHVLQYNEYLQTAKVERRHAKIRQQRSKKNLVGPKGRYFDLDLSFARVNRHYFKNSISKPTLSWSLKRSRRQLGYHDEHLDLIVISRWLDRPYVPQYVVDYIMYHEMLHILIPADFKNGKRFVHTPEFKEKEKNFEFYHQAQQWLNR